MPFIKIVPIPCNCPRKPDPDKYGKGTIWECDHCKRQFVVNTDWKEPGNYWMPYASSKKV